MENKNSTGGLFFLSVNRRIHWMDLFGTRNTPIGWILFGREAINILCYAGDTVLTLEDDLKRLTNAFQKECGKYHKGRQKPWL